MKEKFLLVLLVIILISCKLCGAVKIDGVNYSLDYNTKTAAVAPNIDKYAGDVFIPDSIKYEGITYLVDGFQLDAFQNCNELTSVTIPKRITFIGSDTFKGCDALIDIYITDLEAWCNIWSENEDHCLYLPPYHLYLNGEEIKDLIIPDNITSLNIDNIFGSCVGLNSVTLPKNFTHIGRYAFQGCPNIIIPSSTIPFLDYDGGMFQSEYLIVDAFSSESKIFVPAILLESYKEDKIWKTIANQIYAIEGETDFDISIHAQGQTSDFYSIIGEEHFNHVVSLKLTGTINGHDIKVIRERMPLLRHLDLSEVDVVENDFVYYTDENDNAYHTNDNVLGDYFFYNMQNICDIKLPQKIKEIGTFALSGCIKLDIINIPMGVNKIEDYAFKDCNLKTVIVNDSEPALITSSTFPDRANTALTIQVGKKETYLSTNYWKDFKVIIDSSDFIHFSDKQVERLCVSNKVKNWDVNGDGILCKEEVANVGSLADIVTQGAVLAYDSPFLKTDITSFDELQYFTGLTRIEGWTFYDCKNLSSIVIPENIESIGGGYSRFGPSYSYQEASIVTWKGRDELGAFNGCSSLTSINIPESVKDIDKFAFLGCDGLQEVHIKNMQSWLDIDFGDTNGNPFNWSANPLSYAQHLFLDNKEVTTINFPNGVDKVKQYVFSGCQGLTSVSLPNTIKSLGNGAFRGCI